MLAAIGGRSCPIMENRQMKTLLVAAVAALALASPAKALTKADWDTMQSKAGYDQVFARVIKGVEPMLDGVCNKMRCVTHYYPPNMLVTDEQTGEFAVPLGSSICEYGYQANPNPVRACIDYKGAVWWEYREPTYGSWTPYSWVRYAWAR
jgi:hypothetical protein